MEALAAVGGALVSGASTLGPTATTLANAGLYAGQTLSPWLGAAAPYAAAGNAALGTMGTLQNVFGGQQQPGGTLASASYQPYQLPNYFAGIQQPTAPTISEAPMTGPYGPLIFDLRQYLPEWALPGVSGGY